MKLKSFLTGGLSVILSATLLGCTSLSKGAPKSPNVEIVKTSSLSYLADTIGNKNGYAEKHETELLELIWGGNRKVYIVQGPFFNDMNMQDDVYSSINGLKETCDKAGPYCSTPRGGVNILEINKKGKLTNAWHTPIINSAYWKRLKIPKINFDHKMRCRRRQ